MFLDKEKAIANEVAGIIRDIVKRKFSLVNATFD